MAGYLEGYVGGTCRHVGSTLRPWRGVGMAYAGESYPGGMRGVQEACGGCTLGFAERMWGRWGRDAGVCGAAGGVRGVIVYLPNQSRHPPSGNFM